MKGSKWIPIYGVFTYDANRNNDKDIELLLAIYHSFIFTGLILGLIFLIAK